jgi:hypothetical protein
MTGLKVIIAAYFAILAMIATAGVIVMSVDELRLSRANATDNQYLVWP